MAIELADDPASVYPAIWNRYLSPCYAALQRGDAATCKAVYTQMVREPGRKISGRTGKSGRRNVTENVCTFLKRRVGRLS